MIMHKINVSLIAGLTVLAVVTGPAAMVLAQAPAGAGLDVRGNRETMTKERIKLFGEKAVRRLTTALDRADGFRQDSSFLWGSIFDRFSFCFVCD